MTTKVSDVIALLHPKATKVSGLQALAFLNYEVLEDIRAGITSTWRDEFEMYQEIEINTDTDTEYNINPDYWRLLEVLDQNGVEVEVGRRHSKSADLKNTVLFTFNEEGEAIVRVNPETSITKLIIKYERIFKKLTATDEKLPFPDQISRQIVPILAKGVSYFYLRSRKKTTEVQFIFTEYEDLKSNLFDIGIIEL